MTRPEMEYPFTKYHALGNDFLVIQLAKSPGRKNWTIARLMCDRHTGVGADGVACLSPSKKAEHRIDIYNADGGWAEQSGNGVRIAGVWASWNDKRQSNLRFETSYGITDVQLLTPPADETIVSATIGQPNFQVASLPMKYDRPRCINGRIRAGGQSVTLTCLSVGNPHAVVPVDKFDFDWQFLGAAIERNTNFPRGTNVEFVRVRNRRLLEVKEWERGVGVTGSSGTGAAAAVAAMVLTGRVARCCVVQFPAGRLEVEWPEESGVIRLTGPVSYVMKGVFRAR